MRFFLTLIIFFYFFDSYSQGLCGFKLQRNNSDKAKEVIANYLTVQPLMYSKRVSGLGEVNSSIHYIVIKRHVVRSPQGTNQFHVTETDWQRAIELTNLKFFKTGLVFQYADKIDTIEKSQYYNFQYSESNKESENDLCNGEVNYPYSINMFVVNSICFENSCSINGYVNNIPYAFGTPNDNRVILSQNTFTESSNVNGIIMRNVEDCTLAHELGHFFGLLHTFETTWGVEAPDGFNSDRLGDLLVDTRADNWRPPYNNTSGSNIANSKLCGVNYDYPKDNLMSYHHFVRNRFSDMQIDQIIFMSEKYRGYLFYNIWGQIDFSSFPDKYYVDVCTIPARFQFASKVKGDVKYEWTFPGGTPSMSNLQIPEVEYSQFGEYDYGLKLINKVTNTVEYEVHNKLRLRDRYVSAVDLPFIENFENGLNSNVWFLDNRNEDCTYFSITNVGAYKKSNRSIVMPIFGVLDSLNSFDRILTPIVKVDNLQSLKFQFDYAYTHKSNFTDSLIVEVQYCNGWIEKWRKGGDLLMTAPVQDAVAFLPNENQWKTEIIDLSEILNSGLKAIRFSIKVINGKGNRLYIDNIKISGQSISVTNDFKVNYNKILNQMELIWPDFASDESAYKVERSTQENGFWNEIASIQPNTTSFIDYPANPNTVYWYRVKAEGTAGSLKYSNIDNDTTSSLPGFPRNFSSLISGQRQVLIHWDTDNNLTGYNLFYSFNRNGNYDTLAKLGPNITSYLHENVPSNTRIYYFVKAVDHNFSSLPSDTGFVSFLSPTTSTLTKLEYYFDSDPGQGNRPSVNLNSAHSIDRQINFPVSGLAEGVHRLYFMVQDNIGNWSNVFSNSFLKLKGSSLPAKVDSVEYYFDQYDPGVGRATRIDLTLINGPEYTIPVDLSSLSDGAHILHMRSRNSKGLWSTYWSGGFIKLPGDAVSIINKLEYFIDTDPGFGQGINVPINSLSKIDTSIHLNLSSVSTGLHKLFLRAKDAAGLWSNVFSRNFIRVLGDSGRYVTELEYYFDSEPGIGNGDKVSFPTPKAKIDTVLNLNLASLSDGMHILYVRSKDVTGQWSNIISKSFLRTTGIGGSPKIVQLEYYVDSDPGLGNASHIDTGTLSPGVYDIEIPTNSFAIGEHNLYFRAKDSRGFWSVIYSGGFQIVNNTECSCAKLVYTTSKISGASYQWQVDGGTGFQNIGDTGVYFGTHTDSLKISNPPTSYSFNKYRCLITGSTGTSFSSTFELRYNMAWKGGENDDWHDPKNWGCIIVPDENVDVLIPGSKPNNPVITKDSKVGSLKIETGAIVTVAPGIKLEIKR